MGFFLKKAKKEVFHKAIFFLHQRSFPQAKIFPQTNISLHAKIVCDHQSFLKAKSFSRRKDFSSLNYLKFM